MSVKGSIWREHAEMGKLSRQGQRAAYVPRAITCATPIANAMMHYVKEPASSAPSIRAVVAERELAAQ
jgi:hypothetical protein